MSGYDLDTRKAVYQRGSLSQTWQAAGFVQIACRSVKGRHFGSTSDPSWTISRSTFGSVHLFGMSPKALCLLTPWHAVPTHAAESAHLLAAYTWGRGPSSSSALPSKRPSFDHLPVQEMPFVTLRAPLGWSHIASDKTMSGTSRPSPGHKIVFALLSFISSAILDSKKSLGTHLEL